MTKTLKLNIERIYEDMNDIKDGAVERPVDRFVMPCAHCGSTDLLDSSWYLDDEGEVDALECNSCKAGAPTTVWNQRHNKIAENKTEVGYCGMFADRGIDTTEAMEYALSLTQDKAAMATAMGVVTNTLINNLIDDGYILMEPDEA